MKALDRKWVWLWGAVLLVAWVGCGPRVSARALAHTREQSLPALIELRYDGNLITPNATLDTIRNQALAKRST